MSHYLQIEKDGELVDLIPFCSDWCHRSYCSAYGVKYGGWNGCHENLDTSEECFYCDEPINGGGEELTSPVDFDRMTWINDRVNEAHQLAGSNSLARAICAIVDEFAELLAVHFAGGE